MLRITVLDTPEKVILKLEGALAGSWVCELEHAWRDSRESFSGRLLMLDLAAVDKVDREGKYLLALLLERGVRLVATGFAMRDLVEALVEDWQLTND
jgi:hypothetical protein